MAIVASIMVSNILGQLKMDNTTLNQTRFKVYEGMSEAQREIARLLPVSELYEVQATGVFDIVSGQAYVDISTLERERILKIRVAGENASLQIGVNSSEISPEEWNTLNIFRQGLIGITVKATLVNNNIYLKPVPNSNITAGLAIDYVPIMDELTAVAGNNSPFSPNKQRLIETYCIYYSARVNGYRLDLSAKAKEDFNSMIQSYYPKMQA